MGLDNQIKYEFDALLNLKNSNRTPIPIYVDASKKDIDYGILVMNFLEGEHLNYKTDLKIAAKCLADIHSIKVDENSNLLSPKNPLKAIIEECKVMVKTYYDSPLADEKKKAQIKKMLDLGENIVKNTKEYTGRRCIINTELNSTNFLINGEDKNNYIIDWEKPILGEAAQDLGHFLAPTTTFWKTDVILSEDEIKNFTDEYIKSVNNRFDTSDIKDRLNLYLPITCLRGITWCAMAWVEYKDPNKLIKNESTEKKLDEYLSDEFLDMIEKRYYNKNL
jgi:thiamine kinase-like enzyme